VMFMHIGGMGAPAALATAVGKVFAAMKDTAGGKVPIPTADIGTSFPTFAETLAALGAPVG